MSAAVAVGVPAALTLLSILANASAQKEQTQQAEKQKKQNKQDDRRAAIQRALGTGFERPRRELDPADITSQSILSGLGQLGAQVGFSGPGQKLLGG